MDYHFTSDTHFSHANIIKYAKRPFRDADEMDEELIRRWNAAVKPGDCVYHLGDFAFCDPSKAARIAGRLSGRKFLVYGNHDKTLRRDGDFAKHFEWARDFAEIKVGERKIVLCHYAMRVWNKSHHGSWHLFGHSHGSLPDDPSSLSVDVGVDCWDYAPVSFERLSERMSKKAFRPVDHHGKAARY